MSSAKVLLLMSASVLVMCDSSDPNRLLGGALADDEEAPTESPVTTTEDATANETCWKSINDYRRKAGLAEYKRWTQAETCATGQAKSDARTGMGHGAFTQCGELAQNECPAFPLSPSRALQQCLAAMWREGPGGGHHDAMASTEYTKVACGVYVTASGQTWSVQDFQ